MSERITKRLLQSINAIKVTGCCSKRALFAKSSIKSKGVSRECHEIISSSMALEQHLLQKWRSVPSNLPCFVKASKTGCSCSCHEQLRENSFQSIPFSNGEGVRHPRSTLLVRSYTKSNGFTWECHEQLKHDSQLLAASTLCYLACVPKVKDLAPRSVIRK